MREGLRQIAYKDGYKYQLVEEYYQQLPRELWPATRVDTPFLSVETDGLMILKIGFASDGPSGPTVDTKTFMRGAFVHDALYWMIRNGYLPAEAKQAADRELRRICIEDGMWRARAWWVYQGLQWGGRAAALPENRKRIIYAGVDA